MKALTILSGLCAIGAAFASSVRGGSVNDGHPSVFLKNDGSLWLGNGAEEFLLSEHPDENIYKEFFNIDRHQGGAVSPQVRLAWGGRRHHHHRPPRPPPPCDPCSEYEEPCNDPCYGGYDCCGRNGDLCTRFIDLFCPSTWCPGSCCGGPDPCDPYDPCYDDYASGDCCGAGCAKALLCPSSWCCEPEYDACDPCAPPPPPCPPPPPPPCGC